MTQVVNPSSSRNPTAQLFEGMPLWLYGHSYAVVPNPNTTASTASAAHQITVPGGEYVARLAQRYGFQVFANGVGSSRMADLAWGTLGTVYPGSNGDRRLAAGSNVGVYVIDCELNDISGSVSVADSHCQTGFKHALRTVLAVNETVSTVGGQKIESSSASATGTWVTNSSTNYSGGSCQSSTVVNSSLTFTVSNITTQNHVWLVTFAYDTTFGSVGQYTILVDGVDVTTASMTNYPNWGSGETKTWVGLSGSTTFGPAVVKIPLSGAGSHTVKITKTDATTNPVYVDAIYVPGTAPMPALVLKDPPNLSASASLAPGLTNAQAYNTYAATYHALIDSVVAEFSNAYAVDLNSSSWSAATMLNQNIDTAHLHPNDRGASCIADTIGAFLISTILPAYPAFSAATANS